MGYNEIRVKLNLPLFLSGVFMSLSILFYIESIKYTTLATAVLLLYLGPIIGTGLAHLLLGERVKPINVVLIIIAFLGTAFLLEFSFSFNLESKYGYIFGITSAVMYSLYFVANRKIRKDLSLASRSFYQLFFGALAIFPFLFFGKTGFIIQDIPYLILIGFIHGFLALTLLILALKHLEVFKCGTILYLEPITATVLGWLFFSETISILQLIGGIMILGSGLIQIGYTIKGDTAK